MEQEIQVGDVFPPANLSSPEMPHLYELEEVLGVSRIEIWAAVTAVGNDKERVERYLRDRTGL